MLSTSNLDMRFAQDVGALAKAQEKANLIAVHTQRFNERLAYYGPDEMYGKKWRCKVEGCPVCGKAA